MPKRRGLLSDLSWFQVVASALAAVTAAWIASKLGVAGTLVGAALGSFVVTLSSAFYNKTLDHGRTLLIQTDRGTVIERHVDEGEISDAFNEAEDVDGHVIGARFVEDRDEVKPGLHWKTILATSVIVLAIAMGAITAYELITSHPLGDSGGGTTIGDTFGRGAKDTPATHTPTAATTTPSASTTTPTDSAATPTVTSPTVTTTPTQPSVPTDPATPTATP
ncbi:MAG: hypothetical protein ABIR57_05560 [Aeromicrobium sp.]